MARKLDRREQAFVNHVIEGLSPEGAAKEAGYTTYKRSAKTLMSDPMVSDAIYREFRLKTVSWRQLLERAKVALGEILHPKTFTSKAQRDWVKASDVVSAAKAVMGALASIDKATLAGKATQEDTTSLDDVARRVLGDPIEEPEEAPTPQEPTDTLQ